MMVDTLGGSGSYLGGTPIQDSVGVSDPANIFFTGATGGGGGGAPGIPLVPEPSTSAAALAIASMGLLVRKRKMARPA